jgi:hypothetical protein
MTDTEFSQWLDDEVAGNRMTPSQRQDLLNQKSFFDRQRFLIGREYRNQIVGFVSGQMRVAQEIHALLNASRTEFPGKMVYFEPIGFHLL